MSTKLKIKVTDKWGEVHEHTANAGNIVDGGTVAITLSTTSLIAYGPGMWFKMEAEEAHDAE